MILRCAVSLLFVSILLAQAPITFNYVYDESGQLIRVIDSTGIVIEYVYDAVGNMTEIKRSSSIPGALRIFSVVPANAGPLALLSIQGQGFSATPTANIVRFGTAAATVISATATTLVVQVPLNASTGPISVSVGGSSVSSPNAFNYTPLPAVLSVLPNSALAATTRTITVTGVNLVGSTFSFLPAFVPAAVTITSAAVNSSGTSAVLQLAIGATAAGTFTLVSTNSAGSSSAFPSPGNALNVYNLAPNGDVDGDGLSNADELTRGTDPFKADTDGDQWPDGLEVLLGSDPLDPKSTPNPNVGYASGALTSMLNVQNPAAGVAGVTQFVSTRAFSMLNALNPGAGVSGSTLFISSPAISVLNGISPFTNPLVTQFVSTRAFSMLNALNPGAGVNESTLFISSPAISVLNGISPYTNPSVTQFVSTRAFSMLNALNPGAGVSGSMSFASGPTVSVLNRISPFTNPSVTFVNSFLISIGNLTGGFIPGKLSQASVSDRVAQSWRFRNEVSASIDTDGDGVSDEDELIMGTNMFDVDSDHDGYPDGLEISLGSNPLDPNSIPNINRPGFSISPAFSLENYALKAKTIVPARSALLGRLR